MQYLLFLYGDEDAFHSLPDEEQARIVGAHQAYAQALSEAGSMVAGNALAHPREGKIVRDRLGAAQAEDGPFTDAKEQLGGYYIIEADDLDEALDWASKCPAAETGTIEVRPVWRIA